MNELEQQWRLNHVSRIVLENLGIKQPSFRIWYLIPRCYKLYSFIRDALTPPTQIKHNVSFNDTHPTPRQFYLPIKGLITALSPSMVEVLRTQEIVSSPVYYRHRWQAIDIPAQLDQFYYIAKH
ncbi:hypothetical protein Bca4012_019986 [Brassica carinata]